MTVANVGVPANIGSIHNYSLGADANQGYS